MMKFNELMELMDDHQMFHSEFQIDNFIVAKNGLTPYGMYKQTLRELDTRYRSLRSQYIKREEANELILEKQNEKGKTKIDELKIKEMFLQIEDLERTIRDTEREFKRFYAIAKALKKQLGELTKEKRDALERDFWICKLKCMAALDFFSIGRLSPQTINTIQCCPKEWKTVIWSHIAGHETSEMPYNPDGTNLITWFKKFDPQMPQINENAIEHEVKLLLESHQ